jgi:hypothetical protein
VQQYEPLPTLHRWLAPWRTAMSITATHYNDDLVSMMLVEGDWSLKKTIGH